MNEEPGDKMQEPRSGAKSESSKRLEAKANLQKALDSMARLRATIDRRPGPLTPSTKTSGR